MNDVKTPPNNLEAERAVLGSILIDSSDQNSDRVMDVCMSGGVTPDTFYDPRNREIYATMVSLSRQSKPLDYVTLSVELERCEKLEAVGGAAYLQALVDQTPTAAHAEYYMNVILGKALRRTIIDRATKTITKCYDENSYPDPQTVLGETEKAFLDIGANGGKTMSWSDAVADSFRKIDAMFNSDGKRLEGLSTGLKYLDERLQGLKQSEMIVIAARPSVGKTSLAMNIAESCALGLDMNNVPVRCDGGKRHPVLVFSLEMPVEALSKRMVAGRARVNTWQLNRGMVHKDKRIELAEQLFQAVGELKDAPIYVDDTASLDVMDLRARARRMKKAHGIELIVIDYLQLCRCSEYAHQGRQIEVSHISQQIKAMAKELKVPVIVLSQLNRANEQRSNARGGDDRPKLSDLRDSGAIEQDADVVFLLWRPNSGKPEEEGMVVINVAKNRNGETGDVKVNFIREYVRFVDRPPEHDDGQVNFTTSEPHEVYEQSRFEDTTI